MVSFIVDKIVDSRIIKNKLLLENFEKFFDDFLEDDFRFEDE